ncbi:zinc finger, CCHC-type containing protein [Tanacetum coccineum]
MGLLLPLPQILRPEKSETVGGRDDTFDKEILKKRLVGLEHKLIHATINLHVGFFDEVDLFDEEEVILSYSDQVKVAVPNTLVKFKTAATVALEHKVNQSREERVQVVIDCSNKGKWGSKVCLIAEERNSIRGKVKSLGSTLKDKTLVRKLLNSVPKKFLPIVAFIEQYSEIDEMSFEEAMGRIITFEERIKSQDEPEENYQNKLLMARSSNQNHGNGRGRNLSKGEKGCGTSFQQSTREQNKNKMRCYECGDLGHFARECTKWKKNDKEEKAHFIYETDDEPTLL